MLCYACIACEQPPSQLLDSLLVSIHIVPHAIGSQKLGQCRRNIKIGWHDNRLSLKDMIPRKPGAKTAVIASWHLLHWAAAKAHAVHASCLAWICVHASSCHCCSSASLLVEPGQCS